MRVGIYGGTFSPIHNGHVAAAKAFMQQMWLDVLYVIPTGVTPHKPMQGDASATDRLQMCCLAFEGVEGVIVSDMEIRREGKSYTVDTLLELSRPDDRLFFLCGTDMMLTLGQWYRADDIFRLCYPVYMRRETDASLDGVIVEKIAEYQEKYGRVVRKIVAPVMEISSTEIRQAIAQGTPWEDAVPNAVALYIKEKGLYAHE